MIDLEAARAFLRSRLGDQATDVTPLGAGGWSHAFAFSLDGRELVIRFGAHREDYEIDRLAMRYDSVDLPVPEVLEVGDALGGAYAVSERRHGRFLETLDAGDWERLLPALWRALDAMRAVPERNPPWLDAHPELADGPGGAFGGQLLASLEDRPGERVSGWRATLAADAELDELFQAGTHRLTRELAQIPPSIGHLIHGDLLNRNVLVGEDATHLTAVFDWGCEMRGDFLYELAWFTFWAPWHPELEAIDIRSRALSHFRHAGVAVPGFDQRLGCFELHIGLAHLAYNAFVGDRDELASVARRTAPLAM